jgi:hypothetical protein
MYIRKWLGFAVLLMVTAYPAAASRDTTREKPAPRAEARFAIIIQHFEDGSSRYTSYDFVRQCRGAWTVTCADSTSCMARDYPSAIPLCSRRVRAVRH